MTRLAFCMSRSSAEHRTCCVVVACCFLVSLATSPASAQDYPSRTVRIIVPFGAGGPTDVFTRAIAEELRASLNQPFVMENRPGAGTIIGSEAAAKSPPDGYALLMVSATQTTTETLAPNKPFKLMRDFVPVAGLINSELVMVVHPSVPANNVKEFIALAKSRPGALNYASSGVGSNYHMAGELFKNLTGTNIVHVPYKGSTGARNDIISGQVQMMFDSVPTMAQMIQAGRVRALATSGRTSGRAHAVGSRGCGIRGNTLGGRDGASGDAAIRRRSPQQGDQRDTGAA